MENATSNNINNGKSCKFIPFKINLQMLGFSFVLGKFKPHYIFKGITSPEVQCITNAEN